MPLKSDELNGLGLGQFPIVVGGVVVAVNADGVPSGRLKLTGPVLADIFLGRIVRWSDPAIAGLNPDLRLPDAPIVVIHRSDGWHDVQLHGVPLRSQRRVETKAGSNLMVAWPTGTAAKGNEGVARAVKATRNSIGYVEYAQATQLGLAHALLQNRAGRFVTARCRDVPGRRRGRGLVAASDFHIVLTGAAGDQAYPIAATVFVLDEQDRATSEDSSHARLLPLVAAERQRYRHDAGLCAPPARARAAGRSLLGTNISGRELTGRRSAHGRSLHLGCACIRSRPQCAASPGTNRTRRPDPADAGPGVFLFRPACGR